MQMAAFLCYACYKNESWWISRGDIQGWQAHKTAKRYPKYGVQKGWERVTSHETGAENFFEITDAEAKQLGFPF